MNTLDQAFIRAYSKDVYAADTSRQGVAGASRQAWIGVSHPIGAAPLIETSYANGVWYRIDQPSAYSQQTEHGPSPRLELGAAGGYGAAASPPARPSDLLRRPGVHWRIDPAQEAAPVKKAPHAAKPAARGQALSAAEIEALTEPQVIVTDRGRAPRKLYFDILAAPVAEEDEAPKAAFAATDASLSQADLPDWVRQPPAHLSMRVWNDWSDSPWREAADGASHVQVSMVHPCPKEPAPTSAKKGKQEQAPKTLNANDLASSLTAAVVATGGSDAAARGSHSVDAVIGALPAPCAAIHANLLFEQAIGEGMHTAPVEAARSKRSSEVEQAGAAKAANAGPAPAQSPSAARQERKADSPAKSASAPASKTGPSLPPAAAAEKKIGRAKEGSSKSDTSKAKASAEPAPVAAAKPASLAPAWEVDRFKWPTVCDELLDAAKDHFQQVARAALESAKSGQKVLAITGCHRGEGRTTLALCLARAAARGGAQVALIDAHFEHPQVAAALSIEGVQGWEDAILGRAPLSESAICSLLDRLTVIPLMNATRAAEAAPQGARIAELLRQAAETHDLVVVDMGPTAVSGPRPAHREGGASLAVALVVQDTRKTSDRQIQEVASRLAAIGVEAIGIVETFLSYAAPTPIAASA